MSNMNFTGISPEAVFLLAENRFRDSKAFYEEHKEEIKNNVTVPLRQLAGIIGEELLSVDPIMNTIPTKMVSRVRRDTRYTKDKSPYRDHHWVAFRQAAIPKDGMPFFWFEIRLEEISWGLGIWGENRPMFDALRRRMEADPREMQYILQLAHDAGFSVDGQRWKKMKPPAGLPLSLAGVYNCKSLYFEKQNINPEWIFEPTIVDRVAKDFTALKPVWKLLRGLSDIGEETV